MSDSRTVLHPVSWAAAKLDVSEDTVRRRVYRGELPHHRTGRQLRFTESDIDTYLEMTAVPARGMGRSKPKRTRRAA